MAAAAILDFQIWKNLTVGMFWKAKLHYRAKFRRNRSKYGQDMAIFPFFKMAAAGGRRHLGFSHFENFNGRNT